MKRRTRGDFLPIIALAATLMLPACGGGGMSMMQAPFITVQPASITVPVGQTGTFTVLATGPAPLTFQWSENGMPIDGATSSSFTTPTVVPGDNGSKFNVKISNSVSSVASQSATLNVGPRSPMAGDLRFQQVDAPSTADGFVPAKLTDVGVLDTLTFSNAIGTPIFMGPTDCVQGTPDDCAWLLNVLQLPMNVSGLNMIYSSDELSGFSADLTSLNSHTVVTSLDVESVDGAFAVSEIQSVPSGGFSPTTQTVSPANFQAAATQEGAQARVITAVSFSAGQITFISYGWTNDPSTVYETQTAIATYDQVGATAMNLANQGFIITAFGSGESSSDGFVFVGTRVKGDTLPRPLLAAPGQQQNPQLNDGFAIVGGYFQGSNSGNVVNLIGEK